MVLPLKSSVLPLERSFLVWSIPISCSNFFIVLSSAANEIELLKIFLTLSPARWSKRALFWVGSLIPEAVTYSSNSALHVIQRCACVTGSPIASNTGNPGNPLKHTAICLSFIHCLNSCPLRQPLGDSTIRFPCRQMWCVWFKTRKHQNSFVITQHMYSFICIFFTPFSSTRFLCDCIP